MSSSAQKVRILWVCHSPSPYNDFLFRAIAQDSRFDLHVVYHEMQIESHPWRDQLGVGYRWSCPTRGGEAPIPARRSGSEDRSLSVIAGWRDSTAVKAIVRAIARRRDYVVWTDTPDHAHDRSWMHRLLRDNWLRIVLGRASAVMGTGQPAVDALASMGVPASKLVNFPYWVPVPLSPTQVQGSAGPGTKTVFLSIGRVENRLKGHDIAVRALAAARDRGGLDFAYRIAGDGPDAGSVLELAHALGVADSVEVLGWLNHEEITTELGSCHALLHPSPSHEPYGVAVLEAMAAGRAVLASRCTGAALDRVQSGTSGLLHAPGNIDELASQLISIARDPGLLVEFGQGAHSIALRWPVARALSLLELLAPKGRA